MRTCRTRLRTKVLTYQQICCPKDSLITNLCPCQEVNISRGEKKIKSSKHVSKHDEARCRSIFWQLGNFDARKSMKRQIEMVINYLDYQWISISVKFTQIEIIVLTSGDLFLLRICPCMIINYSRQSNWINERIIILTLQKHLILKKINTIKLKSLQRDIK